VSREFNDKIAEEVFTAEMEVAGEKGRDVIFAL